jgi:hypothetical protein
LWIIVRIFDDDNYKCLEINKINNFKEMLDQLDLIKIIIICGYMKELNKMIGIMENSELFIRMVKCMKVI